MAFLNTLQSLSLQNKLIAAGTVTIVAFLMLFLVQTATKVPLALLYAGVDSQTASDIVTKLEAEGVEFKLDGDRIYVEAPLKDRLRLSLAQEGLPKQSIQGYELLDDLSGFSTTSDMFSAAYWRAKEGELTRTILTMPGVRAARVHIGTEQRSLFQRDQAPRTASVTIKAPGGLNSSQIKAIQHMTALAISRLHPDSVAVIDTNTGLLTASGEDAAGMSLLDENKRAAHLEATLTNLLEARVGRGNAKVTVAIQVNRLREAFTESLVDPDTAVVTNRTRNETKETENGIDRAVTVASDLPDGDNANAESSSERTETSEKVSYAVTTRDRTVEKLPGEIERLSVAVLINHIPGTDDEQSTIRPAEEIAALRALIETAAGIDPERGDKLTIQSLAFEKAEIHGDDELLSNPLTQLEPQLWQAGQIAFVGMIVLILGLFVVKPIFTQSDRPNTTLAELETLSPTPQDPISLLRLTSAEEPDAAADLLNTWLEEDEAA